MRLVRLTIERLPGLIGGISLTGLSAGINLVIGPNASGKSSLCRALDALLYGDPMEGPVSLEAEFETSRGSLGVSRQGTDIHWAQAGEPALPPPLPDSRFRDCFTLRVDDLLAASLPHDPIAARIARDLAGGFDLDQLTNDGPFKVQASGSKEKQEFAAADRKLLRARNVHRGIRERQGRLASLLQQREEAESAARQVEACARSLELLSARDQLRQVDAELAEFPEGMERLTGREETELAALRKKVERREKELEEERSREQGAVSDMEQAAFPDGEPADAELDDHRAILEQLQELCAERRRDEESLRSADRRLDQVKAELGGDFPGEQLKLDPRSLSRVENELEQRRAFDSRIAALDSELLRLGDDGTDRSDLKRLRVGREELFRWLTNAADPARERRARLLVCCVTLVGLFGISAAGMLAHPGYWLLALPELLAAGWLLKRSPAALRRASSEERFSECGLPAPSRWDRWSVEQRLEECDQQILLAERSLAEQERRRQVGNEREKLEKQRQRIEQRLQEVAREVGFQPDRLDASFQRWLRLVLQFDAAREAQQEVLGKLADTSREIDRRRGALAGFLARYLEQPTADAGHQGLRKGLDRLGDRVALLRAGRMRLESTGKNRELLRSGRAELLGEIEELFSRAGLRADQEAELISRLGRLKRWRELTLSRREELRLVRQATEKLGDSPKLQSLAERGEEQELKKHRELHEELAGSLKRIETEITEIRKDVRDAEAGSSLQEARAQATSAREALEDRLDEHLFAEAGKFLVEEVRRQHEQEGRLPVLERAAGLFRSFTRNHFELKFRTEEGPEFLAYDTSAGENRPLEKLSSGTRMQLLLAIRLAFQQEIEQGVESLPVFLDEALTTSDPERYQAVVEAVRLLASRHGRQFFYLTAQPQEVARWKVAGEAGPPVVDLSSVRGREGVPEDPREFSLPEERMPLPEPGITPEEYGVAVGATRVDPLAPVTAMHLFHLLRHDLGLLGRLLRMGVKNVGQLRSFLNSETAELAFPRESVRQLECAVALAEAWHPAHREGRGRPVDLQALQEGGVSEAFLEPLATLNGALEGSAEALLSAIDEKQVKGFHRKSRERLCEHLEQAGFLDPRPVLSEQEVANRVMGRLAEFVREGVVTAEVVVDRVRDLCRASQGERQASR
ncbi:MAG: AAA family ATPase [Planctomycetota bacterium]